MENQLIIAGKSTDNSWEIKIDVGTRRSSLEGKKEGEGSMLQTPQPD